MGNPLGKLDNHAAEVIHHGQQHPAYVIDLLRGDGIGVRGFELANGRHIAHAVDQLDDGFPDAVAQHVFADHVRIR